jgi:branched-chain amino acid transport system permease protein
MFADSIITGLLVGSTYALVAMGLTLQYGIARIMNLAHGEMIIAAAFAALWLYLANILSPLVAAFVLAPVAYISSWFIYRVFLVPLVRRSKTRGALEVDSILCTFGLLFVVQGVMLVLFGGDYYSYSYLSIPVELGEVRVGLNRLVAGRDRDARSRR